MALPSRRSFSAGLLAGRSLAVIAVGLFLAACHPRVTDPTDPKFIVAEKGTEWTITRGELDKDVQDFMHERNITPAQLGPNAKALDTYVLRGNVLEKLMLARAAALQLKDVDKDAGAAFDRIKGRYPTEKDFVEQLKQANLTEEGLKKQIHDEVVIRKVLENDAIKNVEPTDQEVTDFYEKHQKAFQVPPKIRASRVLVIVDEKGTPDYKAARKKIIDQAHARVAKGEDFSKVAMQVSDDKYSAPKGGDIGFFQKGENEAQFDDVAFTLKPNVLSPVFETPMGYQFVKVTDQHAGGVATLAETRAPIVQELKKEKASKAEQDYTAKLLKESDVKFNIPLVEPTVPQGAGNGTAAPSAAPTGP